MEDFSAWFTNPAAMIIGISSIVKIVRDKQPAIDGMGLVALFTVITGTVVGIAGDFAGLLLYEPFAAMPLPAGGALYGAICGASAFLGVNFFDLFFQRKTKAEEEHPPADNLDVLVVKEARKVAEIAGEMAKEARIQGGRAARVVHETKPQNVVLPETQNINSKEVAKSGTQDNL